MDETEDEPVQPIRGSSGCWGYLKTGNGERQTSRGTTVRPTRRFATEIGNGSVDSIPPRRSLMSHPHHACRSGGAAEFVTGAALSRLRRNGRSRG